MSGTYEEHVWMGGDYSYTAPEGQLLVLHGISTHCKVVPTELVFRVHITPNVGGVGHTVWLPRATELPTGGPLYHFIVTADPGVTTPFTVQDYSGLGAFSISYTAPVSLKMYLADNSSDTGLWAWKASGLNIFSEILSTEVASFGASPNLGSVWMYSVTGDTWSTDTDLPFDAYQCGASYTGPFGLVRKDYSVYTYTGSTAALQGNGFAKVNACSFVRMSGTAIGSRHYSFGVDDVGSHASDYFERVPVSFTVIPSNPSTGWTEGATAGVAGQQPQERHHCIQLVSHTPSGGQAYPAWLYWAFTGQYDTIQPLPAPHYQWPSIVTMRRSAHVMGGASAKSNLFNTGTRWHHKYVFDFDGLFGYGWLTKPWIPKALRGHGIRELPGRNGDRRCLFSMGKDHSFFPSNNEEGYRYDDVAESYVAAGATAWTNLQEQNTSWAHAN